MPQINEMHLASLTKFHTERKQQNLMIIKKVRNTHFLHWDYTYKNEQQK
jgi:hypothetical protein